MPADPPDNSGGQLTASLCREGGHILTHASLDGNSIGMPV